MANAGISFATFGVGQSAVKAASIGGKFALKAFGKHFAKAFVKDVAVGFAIDAGIETGRQLVTGTKITNLDYDRIKDAGIVGGIVGGGSTLAGAALEGLANTRVAKSALEKFSGAVDKGANAIKSRFAKIASKNGKYDNLTPRVGSEWNDYFAGKYGVENVEWTSKTLEIDSILHDLQGDGFKNNPLRQAYEDEVRNLAQYADELYLQGYAESEIAQLMNHARRDLGIQYKHATPQPLREFIYDLNRGRYKDPLGPTYQDFIKAGKMDLKIIESSSHPNSDIDKLFEKFRTWMEEKYDIMPR